MIDAAYIKNRFKRWRLSGRSSAIAKVQHDGFDTFSLRGIPTLRHEEWKYTDISSLFKKEFHFAGDEVLKLTVLRSEVDAIRLPGHLTANELVFVNGCYHPELSDIRSASSQLTVLPLRDTEKGKYKEVIREHLGKSKNHLADGIHALNSTFIEGGVFICIHKEQQLEHPVYLYHITDCRTAATYSQTRSLIYMEEGATLQMAESGATLGSMESFSNRVAEIVVKERAYLEHYQIQNDTVNASQVSTTHIRQTGKSYVHALTLTLNGGMIRNNTNIVMEAAGNEAHLYGLYLINGQSHVDNHTLVDNVQPNCFSNEFYKGVVDDSATAVFNGKIIVRPQAQKTNAYQSNKNILLSEHASINTKPQLEIFADDVKCSHGCTVGQLDEEALFYIRTRGIPKEQAKALLLKAFAEDILLQIKPVALRNHAEQLIAERLIIKEP